MENLQKLLDELKYEVERLNKNLKLIQKTSGEVKF